VPDRIAHGALHTAAATPTTPFSPAPLRPPTRHLAAHHTLKDGKTRAVSFAARFLRTRGNRSTMHFLRGSSRI